MSTLDDIVRPWLLADDGDELINLRDRLMWLRRQLLSEYEPSPVLQFDDRLIRWLENVPDGPDRRAMFRLLDHLFFVAKPQFRALCRGAFNDVVARWLLDQETIDLAVSDLGARLEQAAGQTWFCPVTDSMNINSFLKVNNLHGQDIRADWRSLEALGDSSAIQEHVVKQGIRRIAFLEDFVGSGDQMRSTIIWAREVLPDLPILLAPLICCPEGNVTGRLLAKRYNISFAPTLLIRADQFLLPEAQPLEPELFGEVRTLIQNVKARLGDWIDEPFGHADTGAIFSMFSNCPDNSLPIIHHHGSDWNALFPRVRRE